MVTGGVEDINFCGEVKGCIHNNTLHVKQVQQGEWIAQGLVLKTPEIEFVEVTNETKLIRNSKSYCWMCLDET